MRMREIVIRLRLPASPRKRWLLAGIGAVVCSSAIVYATVPNVFTAGSPLSAAQVNANFNALVDTTTNQTIAGAKSFTGVVNASRNLVVNQSNGTGAIDITFGNGSGEGIASTRSGSPNLYG